MQWPGLPPSGKRPTSWVSAAVMCTPACVASLARSGSEAARGWWSWPVRARSEVSSSERAITPGVVGTGLLITLLGRCDFPPSGTEVACAVSGGADSMALLAFAVAAGLSVTAIHVNHGLRPESSAEAARVADVSQRLGAAFTSRQVTIVPGPNLETRALCREMGLRPVEDKSNDDRRFLRNRIRHELLPRLADIAGRDPVPILVRQAEL